VLAYQKYALPEAPAEATVRAPSVQHADVYTPPPSQEAQRESRRLRVGHTMVGMTNPMAATPATGTPLQQRAVSNPPPTFSMEDDPVSIPTSGLPPSVVGMVVLAAMLLVAIAGFLLLR
jgi:hypothetical protein